MAGYPDHLAGGGVPVLSEAVFMVPDQNQWLGSCSVEGEGRKQCCYCYVFTIGTSCFGFGGVQFTCGMLQSLSAVG